MYSKRITSFLLFFSLSSFIYATNGDNLIAMGAKSRGMGGIGIAMPHGAESALANGAMLTSIKGTEVVFGGTLFSPIIKSNLNQTQTLIQSSADTNMIPEVSIAKKINENWYLGFGVWGVAGMGTDYTANSPANNLGMNTNLQLLQFGIPVAFKLHAISLSMTPILLYGNLKINYDTSALGITLTDIGLSQNFGAGFALGFSYNFEEFNIEGLMLGINYRSAISLSYENQLAFATRPFVDTGIFTQTLQDTLEQPQEYGIGLAYTYDAHTLSFDFKSVPWSKTKGYGDFGWEDGLVYATGYQYQADKWAFRCGYNYSKSVVTNLQGAETNPIPAALNLFNILGFPATAEEHFTLGGSYKVNENFSIDTALVYQSESSITVDVAGLREAGFPVPPTITTTHQESSATLQLVYNF